MTSPHVFMPDIPLPVPPRLTLGDWLRAIGRTLAFIAWLAVCAVALAAGFLAEWLRPGAVNAFQRVVPGVWARGALRSAGIRLHVDGEAPAGHGLWVSNHLSYLDPVILLAVRPLFVLAKSEVRGWPGIGTAGRLAGTLFIDRDRKRDLLRVIPEMEEKLRLGNAVLFFPEGTSTHGGFLLRFRSSLFEAAARSGAPVHCVSLHASTATPDPPAWECVCWWGEMTFVDHVFRLLALRGGVDVTVRFAPEPIAWDKDRKRLSAQAAERFETLFTPHDGAPAR